MKFRATLGVILIALLCAGCGEATVSSDRVREALALCKEHGGLSNIKQRKWITPNYECNNGVVFKIYNDAITKITPITDVDT